MSYKQTLVGALVVAVVCCAVMWLLEDFRQAKMIKDFRETFLDKLPSTEGE